MKRAAFVGSSVAMVAAAFLRNVSLAAETDAAGLELTVLVETLLPFGSPAFPAIPSTAVVQRIEGLFKLGESPVFQASLRGFSSLAFFSTGDDQLFAAERAVSPDSDPRDLVRRDAAAFAATGLSPAANFQYLKPERKSQYVRLWSQSAFSVRRRFYGSVRAVTFVAFYSLREAWPAIGYAGPILKGARA
ncbi:MAG TPA: hypothetical protein VMG98_07950 [Verrucomicrobiae bacterium]|nr:hypothetical protein [Verrucomicrobiae bacterium]HTZ54709.1 hypothetical protein [Candidatus Acidoferrum sp.]